MAIAIARFAQPQEVERNDRRTAPRVVTQRRGQIISAQGENALVAIGDVSAHGCSVQCASGWLRAGRFVSIAIEDGAPLQAIVRWVREDHAGLDFLRAVPSDRSDWQALIALDS
jgi:hypothetical protein